MRSSVEERAKKFCERIEDLEGQTGIGVQVKDAGYRAKINSGVDLFYLPEARVVHSAYAAKP